VWDLPVRLMHWALAFAVLGSWLTQELEGDWFKYHVWCGYAVLLIVSTRIVWGLVGTRHARFASFVRGPGAIVGYVRSLFSSRSERTTGHNPLGALMIVAFLGLLLAQAVTGLFANDQIFNTGPLFGYITGSLSDRLTTIHKQLFDVLTGAIALHVLAVLAHWWLKQENLIWPMFTGRKRAADVPPGAEISGSRTWLAAVIVAVFGALLAWLVRTAPPGGLFMF